MKKYSLIYIAKLSFPIFLANVAIPLVGIIDTGLMGNLGNISYLTATSIAANLFSMIFWSFGFLKMGTVGMVSQAHGKNDYNKILDILLRNLFFVIIISLILIFFQFLILNLTLNIFELSKETQNLYQDYFNIRIYSAPGELTLYIITGIFIGLQKTKISSLVVSCFSILNIILSIILVAQYNLNVKGVAYGSLLAGYITSIIFLIYTFFYIKKFINIKIDINNIFNAKQIKYIFHINLNIFIRTILLSFSFLWFIYLSNKIGEEYVAANTILINLVNLAAFILDAYAFATQGLVGYSIGKNDKNLFKLIVKNSFILSAITSIFISIVYLLIHKEIIYQMADIDLIRNLTVDYSIWLIIFPLISSFCYQFDGIFIGASQTVELRNAMIFSSIIYLFISVILTNNFINTGLWISLAIFMILRAVSLYYYFNRIYLRFN
ncbi:MATE family efflux transporter [Candidatus Pelagibacter sp. HIMB1321]|uniref:MATE family efflux transporter n=1 Tax=Candidatus Pelagibacter sp. HIMB1321 TaxID=1388755 RepID=UPI000A08019A|nr:MATE family efflux transporter [Candidatus Pelagibacter sp. HIMB1321]SMF73368.1 multidrug resistance protein, MATE family [Candidatus Pelagibacter sp. HIMB1321]